MDSDASRIDDHLGQLFSPGQLLLLGISSITIGFAFSDILQNNATNSSKESSVKYKLTLIIGTMAVLALALTLSACSQTSDSPEPTDTAAPSPTARPLPTPTSPTQITAPVTKSQEITESAFQYIELVKGDGSAPQLGEIVSVHYTGTLQDGTVFDSSYGRGAPFQFVLGKGTVIPGWEKGIAMMQEGGKARLIIPPDMAYGAHGAGGVIPPNATLTFEVELVSIKLGPPIAPASVDETDYETTENNLKYYDLAVGDGPTAETGQLVTVEYTGWLTDGTMFDSSLTRNQPFSFILGIKSVIPAWHEGVATMRVGGKRQLLIPPELAYGESGASNVIPPNATLIMEIELVSIAPGPPAEPTKVDEADYVTTESDLRYYDLTVGEGPTPQAGQQVSVQYTGWLTDGTMFDSSLSQGQPFSFIIGANQVIPGWEQGIETMQVGGHRQLVVPPDLAYGASGAGNVIPPNATLIFEIELLKAR